MPTQVHGEVGEQEQTSHRASASVKPATLALGPNAVGRRARVTANPAHQRRTYTSESGVSPAAHLKEGAFSGRSCAHCHASHGAAHAGRARGMAITGGHGAPTQRRCTVQRRVAKVRRY